MKTGRIYAMATLCCISGSLIAQSFDGWRGPNHDGVYPAKKILSQWPATGPNLLWKVENAGAGYSSVTVSGNSLYLTSLDESGEKEVLKAYSKEGKLLFETTYGAAWTKSFPNARTTPSVYKGKVYVISGEGDVACINAKDGKLIWSVEAGKKYETQQGPWGTSEAPIVANDKVIYTPVGNKAFMVALDANTGKEVWTLPAVEGDKCQFVTPLLINHKGKKQIVQTSTLSMVGIDLDSGKEAWKFTEMIAKNENEEGEQGGRRKRVDLILCNTPIYKDGKIYVSNGYDFGSFMVELNDQASDVKLLWRNQDLDTHVGGVVERNGFIYGAGWIDNRKGDWCAVDWKTGETKYKTEWSGQGKGNVIAVGDKLVIYGESKGTLALMNPTPEKFDVVSEITLCPDEPQKAEHHWSHPTFNEGVLYVRHANVLMAFKID